MSDIEPDLPDYLVDAILSEAPPAEAIDLVKSAFTWRTIDAELMELSYDSVLDVAGVRDASARRTLEFTSGDLSVVIEVDGLTIAGAVSPPGDGTVELLRQADAVASAAVNDGRFELSADRAGIVRLVLDMGTTRFELPAFAVA